MTPLPERINRLDAMARDLWWSWTPEARSVFRRLDYSVWRQTAHNPVRMLQVLTPDVRARDGRRDVAAADRVAARLDPTRATRQTWCESQCPELQGKSIAYFSAEFALHQSLPIYAGGLGVLAGDHCKEASASVCHSSASGHVPTGLSPEPDVGRLAAGDLREAELDGRGHRASHDRRREALHHRRSAGQSHGARGRGVRVGRVTLYLLDTDLEENAPWIASCRRASMAAIAKRACSRKSSWASAVCAC